MSISSEISRISGAKADIKTAITSKGVTVPSTAKIDDMADYIAQIQGGKAFQFAPLWGGRLNTTYGETGAQLTVSKTGVYTVRWGAVRETSSGTYGSQLYVNGSAYGTAQTTFNTLNNYGQAPELHNVSLRAGDEIEVYARSRSASYFLYVFGLFIEEE